MRDIGKDHQNLTYVESDKVLELSPNSDVKMSDKDKILNELDNLDPPLTSL